MTGYLSKFIPWYASLMKPLREREVTHKGDKFHWGLEEDNAFEELKAGISNKDTMAIFNPKFPIMVRVEANYNEDYRLTFSENPQGASDQCIS